MRDSHVLADQVPRLGQHVVSIADDPSPQLDLLALTFGAALAQECQCVYIGDQIAGTAFVDALALRRCDLASASDTGQFQAFTPHEVYACGGRFDVERVIDGLCDTIEAARRDGFTGLCAAGDAAWIWQGIPGVERLLEYEHRVNLVENRDSALLICLYDGRRTPLSLESELLKCHPIVHSEGHVARSTHFIPGPVQFADLPLLEELEPPADMLPCELLAELLAAHADGELLSRRQDEVARHLAVCEKCADVAASHAELKKLLSAVRAPAPVPDSLWNNVRRALEADDKTD